MGCNSGLGLMVLHDTTEMGGSEDVSVFTGTQLTLLILSLQENPLGHDWIKQSL